MSPSGVINEQIEKPGRKCTADLLNWVEPTFSSRNKCTRNKDTPDSFAGYEPCPVMCKTAAAAASIFMHGEIFSESLRFHRGGRGAGAGRILLLSTDYLRPRPESPLTRGVWTLPWKTAPPSPVTLSISAPTTTCSLSAEKRIPPRGSVIRKPLDTQSTRSSPVNQQKTTFLLDALFPARSSPCVGSASGLAGSP